MGLIKSFVEYKVKLTEYLPVGGRMPVDLTGESLPLPVGASTEDTVQELLTELQLKPNQVDQYVTRSDTFTGAGNGLVVDCSDKPLSYWSIQVKGTGASATLWSVVLEGSLNGVNFSTILTHSTTTSDGVVLSSGASAYPMLYARVRCASVTLGSATDIVATLLGVK